MGLPAEGDGIEGLPLQLLIVVIVAAITAPVVYAGLESYDRDQVESRVRGEVLRLVHAAQQYATFGGGAETLTLDLRGGFMAGVDYVAVGDRDGGPFENAVRYRLGGGDERVVLAERPSVRMGGPGGSELRLGAGIHDVHVEAVGDRVVMSVG